MQKKLGLGLQIEIKTMLEGSAHSKRQNAEQKKVDFIS